MSTNKRKRVFDSIVTGNSREILKTAGYYPKRKNKK